jgi:hypothetical protein
MVSRFLPDVLPGHRGPKGIQGIQGPPGVPDYSALPQWRDLLNVDFRTLPDQDFTVDGPVSCGGQTYVVQQTAKLRAGAIRGIRNGVGNYLGAPNYNGGSSDCMRVTPAIGITWPFYQSPLFPFLKRHTPFRIAVELAFVRGFNDSYSVGFATGFQDDSITSTNYHSIVMAGWKATSGTATTFQGCSAGGYRTGSSRSGGFSNLTGLWASNQRTLGFVCPEGLMTAPRTRWLLGAAAQDAIGDLDSMYCQGLMDETNTLTGSTAVTERQELSTWGANLTSYVDTSNNNAYAVISRWRIQAFFGLVP